MLWLKNHKYDAYNIQHDERFIDHTCPYLVGITISKKMYHADDSQNGNE